MDKDKDIYTINIKHIGRGLRPPFKWILNKRIPGKIFCKWEEVESFIDNGASNLSFERFYYYVEDVGGQLIEYDRIPWMKKVFSFDAR